MLSLVLILRSLVIFAHVLTLDNILILKKIILILILFYLIRSNFFFLGLEEFSSLFVFIPQPNIEKNTVVFPQHQNPNIETQSHCGTMIMKDSHSSLFNLGILDTLAQDQLHEILESYTLFCNTTQSLLGGARDFSYGAEFVSHVHTLCKHGLESLGS
jgi:hypothetical protein